MTFSMLPILEFVEFIKAKEQVLFIYAKIFLLACSVFKISI